MTTYPNANQLRGRAIGTIFFACFGVGWLFMALIAKQQISPATVSGAMLGLVVLLLGAFTLLRAAKSIASPGRLLPMRSGTPTQAISKWKPSTILQASVSGSGTMAAVSITMSLSVAERGIGDCPGCGRGPKTLAAS